MSPSTQNQCCIFCGRPTKKISLRNLTFDLLKCPSCRIVFQENISHQNLSHIYNNQYYDHWFKENFNVVWRMKSKTFNHYLRILERHLPSSLHRNTYLLDIGCAHGAMLDSASRRGWKATGVEVSPASDYALQKGYNVYKKNLTDCQFPSHTFDLVTMVDLIEHIASPQSFLKEIHRIIKKSGLLFIVTPDISHWSVRWLNAQWPHFKKEHVIYYSLPSIKKILNEAGFSLLHTRPAFKYLTFQYILGHFEKYTPGKLASIIKKCASIIPEALKHFFILFQTEMMVIAQAK
jgi:2-polyprenyl-3-methyl-5-hydroxy-6-metoxy-1,4-benzoquinol methylase